MTIKESWYWFFLGILILLVILVLTGCATKPDDTWIGVREVYHPGCVTNPCVRIDE